MQNRFDVSLRDALRECSASVVLSARCRDDNDSTITLKIVADPWDNFKNIPLFRITKLEF